MTHDDYLKANTTLFWLVALIAAGIVFIGVRFIIAPLVGGNGFGVPVEENQTFAYLWAKGTRDVVSGLFLLVFLWSKVSRRVLAAFIFVASLISIGDALIVYANVGANTMSALTNSRRNSIIYANLINLLAGKALDGELIISEHRRRTSHWT